MKVGFELSLLTDSVCDIKHPKGRKLIYTGWEEDTVKSAAVKQKFRNCKQFGVSVK